MREKISEETTYSIRLSKNKDYYTWSTEIMTIDPGNDIKYLEEINKYMENKYGKKEVDNNGKK